MVHSFYGPGPSGENTVVDNSVHTLQKAGHNVRLFARRTPDKPSLGFKLNSAMRVATGRGTSPLKEISRFKPDIVHIHNLFPNFGENWIHELNCPYVLTIHNFRRFCSAGTLHRAGQDCALCPKFGSHFATAHKCYRGSTLQTIPLAIATRNAKSDNLLAKAGHIFFISEATQELYERYSIDGLSSKSSIVANFALDYTPVRSGNRDFRVWVFSGRIAEEKGILDLIEHWPATETLIVFGSGPLMSSAILAARGKPISFEGAQPQSVLREQLSKAAGLIFPSKWKEGGVPLSYLDSLAMGTPVVSYFSNFVGADVVKNEVGSTFRSFTKIGTALDSTRQNWEEYSEKARRLFLETYSAEKWTERTEAGYQLAMHS